MSPKLPGNGDQPTGELIPFDRAEAAAELNLPDGDESTGYLVGTGSSLNVQCLVKGERGVLNATTTPWADFDVEAVGRVVEPGGITRAHLVLLRTAGAVHSVILTPELLSDERKLRLFLSQYDATWKTGPANVTERMAPGVRITRYLKSQGAPDARLVAHLGWDEGSKSFVTFSGVIRADGHHHSHEDGINVVADPALVNYGADFEYGFEGTMEEARELVATVCEWHFPEVMAVYGAWWASTFLKPQARTATALFPFLVLEARSGSAKTTGAFGDLLQLSGYHAGQEVSTRATFRDKTAVNRSGVVWNDDAEGVEHLEEILRAVTADAAFTKKGADNTTTLKIPLVAPVLLSGEGFESMANQKALRDRSIVLMPESPTERMSTTDPNRTQWQDMVDTRNAHGKDFTKYAGHLVQFALQHADEYVARVRAAQVTYRGRFGDKLAILTAGAWLLDEMRGKGDTWAQDLVRAWCEEQDGAYLAGANSLTERIIPWAVQQYGLPEWTRGHRAPTVREYGQEVAPGVMVERTDAGTLAEVAVVWVNTARLAHLWASHHNNVEGDGAHRNSPELLIGIPQVAWSGWRRFVPVVTRRSSSAAVAWWRSR